MLADDHVPRAHSPSWDPSSPCAAEEAGPGAGWWWWGRRVSWAQTCPAGGGAEGGPDAGV